MNYKNVNRLQITGHTCTVTYEQGCACTVHPNRCIYAYYVLVLWVMVKEPRGNLLFIRCDLHRLWTNCKTKQNRRHTVPSNGGTLDVGVTLYFTKLFPWAIFSATWRTTWQWIWKLKVIYSLHSVWKRAWCIWTNNELIMMGLASVGQNCYFQWCFKSSGNQRHSFADA